MQATVCFFQSADRWQSQKAKEDSTCDCKIKHMVKRVVPTRHLLQNAGEVFLQPWIGRDHHREAILSLLLKGFCGVDAPLVQDTAAVTPRL